MGDSRHIGVFHDDDFPDDDSVLGHLCPACWCPWDICICNDDACDATESDLY